MNPLEDVRKIDNIAYQMLRLSAEGHKSADNVKVFKEFVALSDCLFKYTNACRETLLVSRPLPSLIEFLKQNLV